MTDIKWSYTFSTSPNLCHRTTLLNTVVTNCYLTLEFITIRLRVRHSSVDRPPYSEEGTKVDQCPRTIQLLTNRREWLELGSFWTSILTTRWTSCFYWRKAIRRCCPDQFTERSFLCPSRYQKEERQRKPTPSNEIDIQQVSRWTLDRWMSDSQFNCNKFQCYVTIWNICV